VFVIFILKIYMYVTNYCMNGKDKYHVYLNMLKFEKHVHMSRYKYDYDENVKLLIYYLIFQSLYLIL